MPSDKIKSKDLSYESSLPPFLQRLHDQKAGRGDVDRHEFQVARPKREKNPDEDDGPTVVDESGESVSKDELAKLTAAGEKEGGVPGEESNPNVVLRESEAGLRKGKESVTDGAAVKKRKAAKIVGGDAGPEADNHEAKAKKDDGPDKSVKKPKKKAKVKLTFDHDDET